MRKPVIAVVVALVMGVAADAYAGICLGNTCIGSIEFCTKCWAANNFEQAEQRQAQTAGFSDKLQVSVGGKWVRASGVYVSEIEGDTGLVKLERGNKVFFQERLPLSQVTVYDTENKQQSTLAEIAYPSPSQP